MHLAFVSISEGVHIRKNRDGVRARCVQRLVSESVDGHKFVCSGQYPVAPWSSALYVQQAMGMSVVEWCLLCAESNNYFCNQRTALGESPYI